MTLDWLYRLSDWNPQFAREVKGRVKPRSLGLAIAASVLAQGMLLLVFLGQLPKSASTSGLEKTLGSTYCTGGSTSTYSAWQTCLQDSAGNILINWQHWWADIFHALSWALPFVVLMAGTYLLIVDLGKEEKRGTLNFIRLSPQLSQNVLVGKILGVPILPYVAVALALPLHLMAAISGKISPLAVLGIYAVTIATCAVCFTAALLFALLGGNQGWVGAISVGFAYMTVFQIWQSMQYQYNYSPSRVIEWFYLHLDRNLSLGLLFTLMTLAVSSYWIWQAVNRRFRNPNINLWSKQQSYLMTACFEVFLIGFCFRSDGLNGQAQEVMTVLLTLNLGWFMLLIAAVSPHRQSLLDWARYRREGVSSGKSFWNRSVTQDLVWGEKSPSLVAIALNLAIMVAIMTPWILTQIKFIEQFSAVAVVLSMAMFLLICSAIAQMMLLIKSPKRAIWATAVVSVLVLAPPFMLSLLSIYPRETPVLWLFTAFGVAAATVISPITVLFTLLGQLAVLSALVNRMTRQLQKAGESQSKAILASAKS